MPDLRAQGSFVMKCSSEKVAVLLGGDFTLSSDSDAARMADDFANHVLGCRMPTGLQILLNVGFPPANGPLGNVVWPNVGSN